MDLHGNRCILMKTCWGSPWPQHTGFYSTTYSGLGSSLHVNGFLSESDKDYPSLDPWLWRNCQAPYKTTYCWLSEEQGVMSKDEIIWNKFLILRLEKVHPVPPQGPVTRRKHNWITAVCLTIRESVCYVLSSYRLQMVDEEMARIRVNCSPEHLQKINERMENLDSNTGKLPVPLPHVVGDFELLR